MCRTIVFMYRYLFIVLAIVCFACKEQKQNETIVDEVKPTEEKRQKLEFERITFSIYPTLGDDPYSKDVEVTSEGKFYYRVREMNSYDIKANYAGELDSANLEKVYTLYSSIDLNNLKRVIHDGFDMPFYSLRITMYNGEVQMKTTLDDNIEKAVRDLLKIIESQEMKRSGNHKFSTAKDVLIPPPGVVYTKAELDNL